MKKVILYTMKGCPHCADMKDMLKESEISFNERDIHRYEKEYDLFVKATDNEYIPAFMLMTFDGPKKPSDVTLLAPDRDFEDLPQAVNMVREYLK